MLEQRSEGLVGESVLRNLEENGLKGKIVISRDIENHIEEDIRESVRYNPKSHTFKYITHDREAEAREHVENMNPNNFGEDYEVRHIDQNTQDMRATEVEEALEEIGLNTK